MADTTLSIRDKITRVIKALKLHDNGDGTQSVAVSVVAGSAAMGSLAAGTAVIGQVKQPGFSLSDNLIRPANATPYAANKSINCNLTVTAGSYVGGTKTVTLTSNGHGLLAGDRITVAGINTGFSDWANVDGNWVVATAATNTFTFVVTATPTGTTPATASVTGAVAKMMSIACVDTAGDGVIISGFRVVLPGLTMTGGVRVWIYSAQQTVLVDQAAFTLLTANDAYRKDAVELYPIIPGAGSDITFCTLPMWRYYKTEPTDTRLYFRVETIGAGTPTSAGVVKLIVSGPKIPN